MPASSGAIRAGRAFVEVFADDSKLARGLKAAEKKLKAFGTATKEIGTKMMAVGTAITGPLAAAGYGFAKAGSEMAEMSARTGASVEALSALKFAAGQSGVEIGELEKGLRKMQRTIYQAAGGSKTAKTALTRLGLTVADLAKLEPDEQFKRIAEALSKVQDPAVRTGLAMELFGRSGTMMLPMMEQGAAGLNRMASEASSLGLIMSTQNAEAAHAFEKRLTVLEMVLKAVRNAVGSALIPTMTDMVNKMIGAGAAVSKWVKDHRDLVAQIFRTGAIIVGVGAALVGLGYVFVGLSKGVGVLVSVLTSGVNGLKMIGAILTWACNPVVLLGAAIIALGAYLVYASGIGGKALKWLAERFGTLFQDASESWKAIGDALSKGDLGKAAQVLWATLKMEWQRGVSALEELWANFTGWLATAQETGVDAMVTAWINGYSALKSAFVDFDAWYRGKQEDLAGWLAKKMLEGEKLKLAATREIMTQRATSTSGAVPPEAKAEAQKWLADHKGEQVDTDLGAKIIEQSRTQKQKEIETDRTAAQNKIASDQQAQLAMADQAHKDTLAKIKEEKDSKIAAAQAELDSAKKGWKESLTPSGKPTLNGSSGAAPTLGKSLAALKGLSMLDLAKQTIGARGTFNVMEARGLAAGGAADRIAAATEQTAANTQKIVDGMDDGETFD